MSQQCRTLCSQRLRVPSQLATLPEHPESVPINALVAVAGTPLEGREPVSALELARVIATSRLTMPRSVVRLSAGRLNFSVADQVTLPYTLNLDPLRRCASVVLSTGGLASFAHGS